MKWAQFLFFTYIWESEIKIDFTKVLPQDIQAEIIFKTINKDRIGDSLRELLTFSLVNKTLSQVVKSKCNKENIIKHLRQRGVSEKILDLYFKLDEVCLKVLRGEREGYFSKNDLDDWGLSSPTTNVVHYNDFDSVIMYLQEGTSPRCGWVGLRLCESSHASLMKLFIAAGYCDNRCTKNRLLGQCALQKNKKMIDFLLKAGMSANESDDDFTPLCYAILSDSYEIVEQLIKAGAEVNKLERPDGPEMRQERPLTFARRGGHKEIMELLKAHGAVE
jgi:hypothetical protein